MDWGEMAGRDVTPFAGVCDVASGFTKALLTHNQIRESFHNALDSIWTVNPKPKVATTQPNDKNTTTG